MENQGNGQADDRITKLVKVLDQILPSVTNSPNPLRVEEVDEVREDRLSDLMLCICLTLNQLSLTTPASDQQCYIENSASDQQCYIENSASDQK